MQVRDYAARDRAACLRILESNTPRFVAPPDRPVFERFLDALPGPYLVVELDRRVVACGGWHVDDLRAAAVLTWGMVAAPLHRRGVGRYLIRERLERIRAIRGLEAVIVRTTPRVTRFFEREGFRVVRVVPDGFGSGLDQVEMELSLVRRL